MERDAVVSEGNSVMTIPLLNANDDKTLFFLDPRTLKVEKAKVSEQGKGLARVSGIGGFAKRWLGIFKREEVFAAEYVVDEKLWIVLGARAFKVSDPSVSITRSRERYWGLPLRVLRVQRAEEIFVCRFYSNLEAFGDTLEARGSILDVIADTVTTPGTLESRRKYWINRQSQEQATATG